MSAPVAIKLPNNEQDSSPEPAGLQPEATDRHVTVSRVATSCSIADVWRDALGTLSAHSSSILLLALAGFAAVTIIGAGLRLATVMYAQVHRGGSGDDPLANILTVEVWRLHLPELFAIAVGAFMLSLGRGAIAWIALRTNSDGRIADNESIRHDPRLTDACRAAFTHMPALIASSLIYGAALATGQVGLTPLFSQINLDVPLPRRFDFQTAELVRRSVRSFVWEGESIAMPDPGAPFTDLLPHLRDEVFGYNMKESPQRLFIARPPLVKNAPAGPLEFWLITLASLAVCVAAELLLRFRTVMIMRADKTATGLVAPLIASARFSLMHCGTILIHVGLLRLLFFALSLAFIVLPSVVVLNFLIPRLQQVTLDLWIRPVGAALVTSSIVLVGMLLSAFGAVYDARLYAAIEPPSTLITALRQPASIVDPLRR
jgi:hypothetical protein